ncbi:MAG: hypothetical protein C4522_04050 [Desulfobacteraceae bacterium]|nr:MAG: hypothetical protein C4522_04050 [Desulfobacteraceae bacterium]
MCENQERKMPKDNWEKFAIITKSISLLLIPLVIAFWGKAIDTTLKKQEIAYKYIEIAISVMKEKPAENNSKIKNWAVEVLRTYSPIPIDSQELQELQISQMKNVLGEWK